MTSFNYKDETYVVAEDLLNYQINVRWDADERILYIDGFDKENPATPSFNKADEYIIEETDIRTCIKAKKSEGSTSFESVRKMLKNAESFLKETEN